MINHWSWIMAVWKIMYGIVVWNGRKSGRSDCKMVRAGVDKHVYEMEQEGERSSLRCVLAMRPIVKYDNWRKKMERVQRCDRVEGLVDQMVDWQRLETADNRIDKAEKKGWTKIQTVPIEIVIRYRVNGGKCKERKCVAGCYGIEHDYRLCGYIGNTTMVKSRLK